MNEEQKIRIHQIFESILKEFYIKKISEEEGFAVISMLFISLASLQIEKENLDEFLIYLKNAITEKIFNYEIFSKDEGIQKIINETKLKWSK